MLSSSLSETDSACSSTSCTTSASSAAVATATSSASAAVPLDYTGIHLAPMVRCGTLPLRALALHYGANLVWGEEIIAQRLSGCVREVNEAVGTVDFWTTDKKRKLVLRTCRDLERGRFVCQLGVSTAEHALAAAKVVEADVDQIDINMGCPKKFSVQGGMGAALLKNQEAAVDIVRTLAQNLSIPVSAKIRLLETEEKTVAFAKVRLTYK